MYNKISNLVKINLVSSPHPLESNSDGLTFTNSINTKLGSTSAVQFYDTRRQRSL